MACGTPVVASAVGGIPEVVADGETGRLVSFEATGPSDPEPLHPQQFARDLADAVNELLSEPDTVTRMGRQARQRVEECFGWQVIAQRTLGLYEKLVTKGAAMTGTK
jgi:starch synthase